MGSLPSPHGSRGPAQPGPHRGQAPITAGLRTAGPLAAGPAPRPFPRSALAPPPGGGGGAWQPPGGSELVLHTPHPHVPLGGRVGNGEGRGGRGHGKHRGSRGRGVWASPGAVRRQEVRAASLGAGNARNPQRGGRGLPEGRNPYARGGFRADRKRGRTRCRDSGPWAAMEAALTDMYDQALLGILQHVGNVEEFLRILFGFLYRKTDFYRLLLRPGDRLGFPPGAAQAMALQAFRVFERMARQDDEKRRREMEAKLRKKEEEEEAAAAAERVKLCPAAQEIEVETTEHIPEPRAGEAAGSQESAAAQGAAAPSPGIAEPLGAAAPAELPMRQEQFQTNPDSYNGAVRENYTWSQDYSDLEIKVPVPKHIVKGKQVSVDISSGAIRVAVLEGSSQHILMEGKLTHKINTESSLWSLEPGKCVLINLNKGDEYWWNAILEGEEQIDIDKINKERSMATVDEEEHAVLDRLTFDYHQKLQGKPQSHELKVHEMLKKGWDTEGSPFRGQKFDPSMFNISPGAVQF